MVYAHSAGEWSILYAHSAGEWSILYAHSAGEWSMHIALVNGLYYMHTVPVDGLYYMYTAPVNGLYYMHTAPVNGLCTHTVLLLSMTRHYYCVCCLISADVLTSQGVEKIIAIDVGSEDNNDLTNYGDHISGWYIIWNKLNPFAEKLRVSTCIVNACAIGTDYIALTPNHFRFQISPRSSHDWPMCLVSGSWR